MASRSTLAVGSRIVILLLLILVILVGGLLWFDYLGVVRAKDLLRPVFNLVGVRAPAQVEDVMDADLLEKERVDKLWEALGLKEEELNARDTELSNREAELQQLADSLDEREKALEEREKSFNEALKQDEDRRANLRTVSQQLTAMPPSDAVDRLLNMDDQAVIDLMRTTDTIAAENGTVSLVSTWILGMPPDRAAEIQRKMLLKPGSQAGG